MVIDMRSIYLVTLSHCKRSTFQNKRNFAQAVSDSFEAIFGSNAVVQWVCAEEKHEQDGRHYHCVIKLRRSFRWLRVKQCLREIHRITVDSAEWRGDYHTAYEDICKEDREVTHIEGHKAEEEPPRTQNASKDRMNQRGRGSCRCRSCGRGRGVSRFIAQGLPVDEDPEKQQHEHKRKRLTRVEVAGMVKENNIADLSEFLVLARRREEENQDDTLVAFLVNNSRARVEEIISLVGDLTSCIEEKAMSQKPHMDKLKDALQMSCGCTPQEFLKQLAKQTLEENGIALPQFAGAILTLIRLGRGKGRNIFLVGRANCGKSFLLRPIQNVFKTLTNPASNTFSFAEVVKMT